MLIPYQESSLSWPVCWIEFYSLFVHGFGDFLLSIHLFIQSLYNFRVSITCVIDLVFLMDCDNPFEKKRLRNVEKINVTLQNVRFFLQVVGSLWSIIMQDFRLFGFLWFSWFRLVLRLYIQKRTWAVVVVAYLLLAVAMVCCPYDS